MNRVYKVIWSKAKHCYVVTSEIAKSHTKGESTGRGLKKLAAALLVAAALMGPNFAWAADTVTVDGQPVYTVDGAEGKFATKTDLAAKANADDVESTYAKTVDVANTYVNKTKAEVTYLTVSGDVEANGNLKVGNGNFTVDGSTGDVTTGSAAIGGALTVDGDTEIGGDLGVTGNLFAGGNTETDAKAALNADGSIKGAEGKFTVGTDGKVTAASGKIGNVDITSDGALTGVKNLGVENIEATGTIKGNELTDGTAHLKGGDLNTTGNINAHDIVATGDISGKAISGTTITGTSLNTLNGEINGGDIKSSGTIHADDKITGNGLDAGSGAINGGSLSVTGAMEGNSLTLKGGDLDAGSGTITTKGNIKAYGTITTKNLEVTDGFKTDHITLGSETNNYTDIYKGNVTSEVHKTEGGVEYIAESIFNKDGSSITAKIDEGATGKSIVGAKEISQYLGNNAEPKSSDKNVTRSMVRNGDTFSMEDKAVDEGKSSTVSQNAEERKVTVTDGTKNLNVTENLTNGIVSETNGGAGKTVTLTQGMDGTYKVETSGTSTEEIGGQKIENYKGGLATNITGDETHHVTKNQTITVTGKSSLSAADIENKASSSIWNHVGEGENTSWKMTNGTVVESVKDASGKTNQTTTTAADTYQFVKDGDNTLAKRTSSTNDNLNITDSNNTYTKITTATGNKQTVTDGTETASTNLTKEASNTLIENGTQSVLDHMAADTSYTVMNENGNGSRRQQTASEILDRVTDGTDTSEVKQTASEVATSAKDISNTATDKITSQIGDDSAVKSEMTADGITNTAQTVKTITGNNTVTSNTKGTTFVNTGANAALKKGNEQGSRTETRIFGNQVEAGKVETDFADVNNNLTVGGSTTLGRDGKTNLTVNSKSEFKDTVKMDKTLDVDGNTTLGKEGEYTTLTVNSESTFKDTVKMDSTLEVDGTSKFNNKVTITKGGLDVKGVTATDSLKVTGVSEFGGEANFNNNVSMGNDLAVKGETRTGTLHVENGGYVGGDLIVDGNIETHDAVLSADSRQVVTGRQLYQTNERVDRLDNRIKKVGANAAALAALRPGDFNPDDKFSIAAGFGSYRNANAAALGLFYRPNENVLLSLGTSFGDGENMVNAGVSVKFGRGKSMAERRKEMADEVSSMRDEMRSQDERIAELEEMLKKQSELIEKLSKES